MRPRQKESPCAAALGYQRSHISIDWFIRGRDRGHNIFIFAAKPLSPAQPALGLLLTDRPGLQPAASRTHNEHAVWP